MPKARVYELAKELGVDSKTVLSKLEAMGEFVKSASSTVEPPVARKLRNAFASSDRATHLIPRSRAIRPRSLPNRHLIPCQSRPLRQHRSRLPPQRRKPRHAASKSDAPKPGHRAPRPGESRQHGNRPNGNAPRPQGGDRRQSGRPTAVPGARPQHGNAPQGGNNANGAKPHTPGPRPGNNPFSRKQGMHTPTPGDLPRAASDEPSERQQWRRTSWWPSGSGRWPAWRLPWSSGSGRREARPVGPASSGSGRWPASRRRRQSFRWQWRRFPGRRQRSEQWSGTWWPRPRRRCRRVRTSGRQVLEGA